MSKTILVVDDDQNLRETLEAVLKDAGVDVVTAGTAESALETYEELSAASNAPSGIFLDLLLPKKSGFDCAKALKQLGYSSTLVMSSGVFKSSGHKEEVAKLGAAFLQKPFSNETLLDAFGIKAKEPEPERIVPQQPLPAEGSLVENPVLHLLWRASREAHTGILDIFGDHNVRGRVFLFKGRATLAQHSDPDMNVGINLIRQGVLTAEMYQQVVDQAMNQSRGLHELIKAEGWADDAAFKNAYRSLNPVLISKMVACSGRFRWTATDAFSALVPSAPTDVMSALLAGMRSTTLEDLTPHVEPRGPLRLAPGKHWDEMTSKLEAACGASSLARAINGRATIAQLVGAARNENDKVQRMRQVYLLMSTQAVQASLEVIRMGAHSSASETAAPPPATGDVGMGSSEATTSGRQVAPSQSVAPPSKPRTRSTGNTQEVPQISDADVDASLSFSAADEDARTRIANKHAEISGKKHWEVLGLNQKQSEEPATLKKAYFALARDWHTDSFSGMTLGSAQRKLDEVFSSISQAYATLSSPAAREAYEAQVRAEEEGMSADIGAIFQAEQFVSKGKLLLERGEINAAAKLFAEAHEVHPGNPEWAAYHAYTSWWHSKNPQAALQVVGELDKLAKEMPAVVDLLFFAGRILAETGDHVKADRYYRKCLQVAPDHPACLRERRALKRKMEEAEAKGGLGRFLKR